MLDTYRGDEVGGGGGHSGSGGGRGVPECFGQKGPHHSVTGEEQPTTQQPQRDMQLRSRKNIRIYLCLLSSVCFYVMCYEYHVLFLLQ